MAGPITQDLKNALQYDINFYNSWRHSIAKSVVDEWNKQLREKSHLTQRTVDIHEVADQAAAQLIRIIINK
jgi:hypothetical protein